MRLLQPFLEGAARLSRGRAERSKAQLRVLGVVHFKRTLYVLR